MMIRSIDDILNSNTFLRETDVMEIFGVKDYVIRKWRNQKSDPLKYSKSGKERIFLKKHVIEFMVNNMVGVGQAEKKKLMDELTKRG